MSFPLQSLKRLVDPSRSITYGIVQAGEHIAEGVPYIRPIDMAGHSGVDAKNLQRTSPEIAAAYRRSSLRTGDVVVSIGPSFGKTMLVPAELDGANLTQGTARVAVREGVAARFVLWCLQSKTATSYWESSVGGATFRALNLGPLSETPIPSPPLAVQWQISDFLDHETAEIDAFIADLTKMRSLTRERLMSEWAALFTQAMSGPLTQVRHVVDSLVDGPFGSGLTSAHYVDEGSPVVRLGNIGRYRFEIEPRVYISRDYAAELRAHAVRPGDVVIAGLGDVNHPLGRAAVVPVEFGEGIVKADCYRARVNRRVSAEYLAWSLSAPQTGDSFREMSRGSTRARLNLSVVAATSIPVPEREAQDRLVVSYEAANATAASALQEIDAAIAFAKERRAALITAAVTGQIHVTTEQTRAVDSARTVIEEAR